MTFYELDAALAADRRATLLAEAEAARRTSFRVSLRSRLATTLRGLADAVEPAPLARPRTAA